MNIVWWQTECFIFFIRCEWNELWLKYSFYFEMIYLYSSRPQNVVHWTSLLDHAHSQPHQKTPRRSTTTLQRKIFLQKNAQKRTEVRIFVERAKSAIWSSECFRRAIAEHSPDTFARFGRVDDLLEFPLEMGLVLFLFRQRGKRRRQELTASDYFVLDFTEFLHC